MVKNQFVSNIQILHTDNDREYDYKEFYKYF